MKAWTHWVLCKELSATHGRDYRVKAVQVAGVWRLAERNFGQYPYGMELTEVRAVETR
jgi:hypothetical protein